MLLQTQYFANQIPPTTANIKEVSELVSHFWNQILDSPKLKILHKTLKTARFAFGDEVVLNCINMKLLAVNT